MYAKLHRLLLITILFLGPLSAFSQDILFFKNGTKDTVKVIEVTSTEIVYKKFKRLNGPDYRVNKKEVSLIEFSDGEIEIIETPEDEKDKSEAFRQSLGRNIISLNVINLYVNNINAGYERISRNGFMGVKLIVNYHVEGGEDNLLSLDRKLIVGADLNIYPKRQGRVRYFVGTSIRFGRWVSNFFEFFPDHNETHIEYNAVSIFINNGVYIQATRNFFISFQGGLGYANLTKVGGNTTSYVEPDGVLGLNLGVRF